MPNNKSSGSNQPTPMPRNFTGGANPLKVVRILDGNAIYSDTYSDGDLEGETFRSEYNAHCPEESDDEMIGLY